MPFSRYQIRNEFSLADPELYKSADKDDPEALLEGVAMAGLVGVLRQLGDLAEFAAEIFHGLHEEVMATAARGHGLLTRVQQVESDLPIIERAFLSQTSHSAFFSSSGINWHPNLQTEQNLITKGDLPRFVMDSYEECRGPPRLFLLDKFDVAGAGACLKRYTDPSFYKVEVSSYEMMNAETQRDQKIRKTKKKGPRWKNGDTPDVFQPSHVKLHQLLLEERVQNNTSEPARRVKIKKRETKFPFDTETGKGYMEKILNSPPEDKLVHEVKMVNSPLHLPTHGSEELEPEILDVKTVNSFLDDIEEKHISVVEENKEDGIEDVYQSDDVASETDNYVDALATMESEVETDVEKTRESKSSDFVIRQESFSDSNLEKIQESKSSDIIIKQESFSDSNLEKIQESKFSDSQSVSDDESNAIENKITSFSYSDSDSIITSPNDKSPRGINPPHAFASTEIPFRPRVLPAQVADNCNEVSDNADLLVDQETIFKESDSKDLLVDVNIPTKKEEIEIDPEDVVPSVINEDNNSHSTLVNLHVEDDDAIESKCNSAEITELKDEETLSVDSESQNENVAASERDDNKDGDNKSFILEDISESKDSIHDPVLDNSETNETKMDIVHNSDESVEKESFEESPNSETNETKMDIVHNSDESVEKESFEESVISPELDFVPSGYCDSNGNANSIDKVSTELIESDEEEESGLESVLSPESNSILDNNICGGNENDVDNLEKESVERDERKESSVESDSIPTVYNDHKNIQILDNIHTKADENDVDNPKRELNESNEKNESIEESVISPESDSIPSAYDDQLGTEFLDIFQNNGNGTDIESSVEKKESNEESDSIPSASYDHSKVQHETVFVAEKTGQNGLPDAESAEPQESKSSSVDQNSQTNKLKADQVVDLLLPKLSPVNMEEMPPLPPLPPMQWITGRFQNPLLTSMPGGGQADISHIPSVFPETETQPFPNQNEISRNEKHEDDYEVDKVKFEDGIINEKESHGSISEPEIIRLASTSSLPSGDNEMPNGIRPMKIQRPRTPLIDAVAAHDKNKLRKVTERATPLFPKDEEKDTFLQQIRAKSFNLKPAVPTRPIIQGPTTNLRVAAILEKANAIRQAFAGSDDDEDDNDSWSDS